MTDSRLAYERQHSDWIIGVYKPFIKKILLMNIIAAVEDMKGPEQTPALIPAITH